VATSICLGHDMLIMVPRRILRTMAGGRFGSCANKLLNISFMIVSDAIPTNTTRKPERKLKDYYAHMLAGVPL
jgi:hypothetical protein